MSLTVKPPVVTEKDDTRWYEVSHPETGKRHLLHSVTTVQHRLRATALENWKHARIAVHLAADPVLCALAASDPWGAAQEALKRAPMLGTAVHGVTEIVDGINGHAKRDGSVMPPAVRGHAMGYQEALAAHGVEIVGGEQIIVNFTHGYAGRFDRFMRLPILPGLFVGDVKTAAGVYPDMGLQMSAYANAEWIVDAATGECRPLPDDVRRDYAICIHTTEGGTRLVPVQIRSAWEAFKALAYVGRVLDGPLVKAVCDELVPGEVPIWETPPEADLAPILEASLAQVSAKRKRSVTKLPEPRVDPPATAAVEEQANPDMARSIEELIDATNDVPKMATPVMLSTDRPAALKQRIDDLRAANHLPLLKANWPADIAMGNPTPQHTTAQLDAIEGALWAVEGAVRAPFPGADEPVPRIDPERLAARIAEDKRMLDKLGKSAPPKVRDEGGPLDAATVAELKTTAGSIRTAAPKQWGWVERALRDMRQLGHPLDVSNNPTVRTGALLRALMAVSAIAMEADGDNGVRELLASVTGSEQACHPTVSIPEFFATLTIDEARALCALLDMQPTIVKGTAA